MYYIIYVLTMYMIYRKWPFAKKQNLHIQSGHIVALNCGFKGSIWIQQAQKMMLGDVHSIGPWDTRAKPGLDGDRENMVL